MGILGSIVSRLQSAARAVVAKAERGEGVAQSTASAGALKAERFVSRFEGELRTQGDALGEAVRSRLTGTPALELELERLFPSDHFAMRRTGADAWSITPADGGAALSVELKDGALSVRDATSAATVPVPRGVLPGTFDIATPLGEALAAVRTTQPGARAQASWKAVTTLFAEPLVPGTLADSARSAKISSVWPHGQAIAAALDCAQLSGDPASAKAMITALDRYQTGGAYAPDANPAAGSPRYFDDNAWIGLGLMQAWSQTGDAKYLKQARSVLDFLRTGVSPQGGLLWVEAAKEPTRNTCSNGPAAELAARVFQATHDPKDLAFAQQLEGFLASRLRTPEGLYADHVRADESISPSIFSYNQGTPLGADVLLYRATGDTTYLDRAKQTAQASLDWLGQGDRLWKQAPSFNAIFFRNLLALDAVAPDPRYRATLQSYLDRAWSDARDPATGLFTCGDIGAYGKPGNLLDQSGLAQMYSLLAMSPAQLALVT